MAQPSFRLYIRCDGGVFCAFIRYEEVLFIRIIRLYGILGPRHSVRAGKIQEKGDGALSVRTVASWRIQLYDYALLRGRGNNY